MNYVERYKERRKYLSEHCKGICCDCGCGIDIGDDIWTFHNRVYCSECVEELKDEH